MLEILEVVQKGEEKLRATKLCQEEPKGQNHQAAVIQSPTRSQFGPLAWTLVSPIEALFEYAFTEEIADGGSGRY